MGKRKRKVELDPNQRTLTPSELTTTEYAAHQFLEDTFRECYKGVEIPADAGLIRLLSDEKREEVRESSNPSEVLSGTKSRLCEYLHFLEEKGYQPSNWDYFISAMKEALKIQNPSNARFYLLENLGLLVRHDSDREPKWKREEGMFQKKKKDRY